MYGSWTKLEEAQASIPHFSRQKKLLLKRELFLKVPFIKGPVLLKC